ncbi:phytanoyl-CoA dioxygenase family protein [Thalassospira lucentensis]|uniref:phytanoyl-CoA dioxygenase family protein n=1 Tax=Thalassospira lucentensis TaxID=168935 RepID=UPI0003B57A11|nr:phytanoyl-CoA dioxygenase family protein [Thalassospira lucentensis]RCK18824.1 hypothetical protein TH1_22200 [Thalassospira lucentensis MCCC 1A00383 = DSM 14000]
MVDLLDFNVSEAYRNMTDGEGIHVVENFLPKEACEELKKITLAYEADELGTVRCLLDKSEWFERILLDDNVNQLCSLVFGSRYRLGSLDIKVVKHSDARSEEFNFRPHVDFPASDMIDGSPGKLGRFFNARLGLKLLIPLDALNQSNGAMVYIPNSHHWNRNPKTENGEFQIRMENNETKALTIPGGSMAMWFGPLWHADLDNQSDRYKFLTHICITPEFVSKPQAISEMYPSSYLSSRCNKIKKILGLLDEYPSTSIKTHIGENNEGVIRSS